MAKAFPVGAFEAMSKLPVKAAKNLVQTLDKHEGDLTLHAKLSISLRFNLDREGQLEFGVGLESALGKLIPELPGDLRAEVNKKVSVLKHSDGELEYTQEITVTRKERE